MKRFAGRSRSSITPALLLALLLPACHSSDDNPQPPLVLNVASPEWQEQIVYFVMTDRFNDADATNDDQHAGEFDPTNNDYDAQRARLHSVYIAPMEIFLAPDSPYKGIEPEQMAALTRAFSDALRENVLKSANVVDTPQPDSMILQPALTDVRLTKRSLRLRDLTPVGAAINGVKRVAGISKVSLTTLTVQAVGVAPDSDGALFAINNPPPPGDAEPEPVRLDQVPALLDKKAERLRAAFTAIREQR